MGFLIGFFIGPPLFRSALLQPITWRIRRRPLAYFNLSVVDVRQQLVEVAHVEPFSAARALYEMIGLGLGDAVRIDAGVGAIAIIQ
jgi:hypothetical protein